MSQDDWVICQTSSSTPFAGEEMNVTLLQLMAEFKEKMTNLENRDLIRSKEIKELKAEMKDKDIKIDALVVELQHERDEIKALRSDMKTKDDQIATLTAELQSKRDENKRLRDRTLEDSTRLAELEQKVKEFESQSTSLPSVSTSTFDTLSLPQPNVALVVEAPPPSSPTLRTRPPRTPCWKRILLCRK